MKQNRTKVQQREHLDAHDTSQLQLRENANQTRARLDSRHDKFPTFS